MNFRSDNNQVVNQLQNSLAKLKFISNKFINTLRKGENYELRTELNSEYRERRKEAVRRVIANMTIGKDVSGLFTDVLKNMQTDDLEIKKLIYLYLINYAKVQPELVILAINTFVKDSEDKNPLLRALSIRTMGCLQVPEILDYIIDPLKRCLRDKDAYVRKTAVVCVAKIYELSSEAAIEYGLVSTVKGMVTDPNAIVVANVISSLREMNLSSRKRYGESIWTLNKDLMEKLLKVLNDTTEWGQVSILEALAEYEPVNSKEAERVCDGVLPRLQHANGSVVLTAIRVLLQYEKHVNDEAALAKYSKKMVPPLVSLMSAAPEMQYVALRSIGLVIRQRPKLLRNELRVFYCKYNDPDYIKFEKMELLVALCEEKNIEILLAELGEYAREVDSEVSKRAIIAIEKVALQHQSGALNCAQLLIELLNNKGAEGKQHCCIALSSIARTYNDLATGIISQQAIPTLIEQYEELNSDAAAKASLIDMVGEYELDESMMAYDFLETLSAEFLTEEEKVQLAIVHSTVKYFLKNPSRAQELLLNMLKMGTESSQSMDVRDVSYMYWRMLSESSPAFAKRIILVDGRSPGSTRPTPINPYELEARINIPPHLLDTFLRELGSISSVLRVDKQNKQSALLLSSLSQRTAVGAIANTNATNRYVLFGEDHSPTGATSSYRTAGVDSDGMMSQSAKENEPDDQDEPELLISF